jgi:hypothetical protein
MAIYSDFEVEEGITKQLILGTLEMYVSSCVGAIVRYCENRYETDCNKFTGEEISEIQASRAAGTVSLEEQIWKSCFSSQY